MDTHCETAAEEAVNAKICELSAPFGEQKRWGLKKTT